MSLPRLRRWRGQPHPFPGQHGGVQQNVAELPIQPKRDTSITSFAIEGLTRNRICRKTATMTGKDSSSTEFRRRLRLIQWTALTIASVAVSVVLEYLSVPAGHMIGPMLAAIGATAIGVKLKLPSWVSSTAFAVIGVVIAAAIEPGIFTGILDYWFVALAVASATLVMSTLIGLLFSRWRILPIGTAIWGSAPGAASAIVLMADAFGADVRLVAFMQYVRVVTVSVVAAVIARFFVDTPVMSHPEHDWFPAIDPAAFGATFLVAAGGYLLGRLVRLPSPAFIGPLILGVLVHAGAGVALQLPDWLVALAFLILGWSIGLRFDRATLVNSLQRLPHIMAAVLILIVICGAMAWMLAHYLDVSPATAYLATSPGGMDAIAVIATAADDVDVAFVMAMQMTRFVFVLLTWPLLARWLARRVT